MNPIVDRLTIAGRNTYTRLSALSDSDLRSVMLAESDTAAGAVIVDLLDRLVGYQQTIARLTEKPPSNSTDTSDAAAVNVAKNLTALRMKILAAVAEQQLLANQPTSDSIEALLDMSHQTVSARFNDLRKMGLIDHTGAKTATRTGNKAMVHQLTPEGWRQLRNSRIQLANMGYVWLVEALNHQ